jgi:hypothetical protein
MHSLKENPLTVKYKNAPDGLLYYNFYNIHLVVQQLLYDPALYPFIPWLIIGIEEKNKDIFKNLTPQFEAKTLNYSDAMFVTVLKYDNGLILSDYYSEPDDPLHDALNYFDNVVLMMKQIDFISQDQLETLPVFSEIPSLILAGSIDPITPPNYAHILKQSLTNSFLFEFPGRGHGLTRNTECAKSIGFNFLNDPFAGPEFDCMAKMEADPISWVVKMYYNPRIATLGQQMLIEKRWSLIGGVTVLALSFIISIVVAFINLLKKNRNLPNHQVRIRNIITRVSAFLAMLLFSGLVWFIVKTGNNHGPLLLVGLVNGARIVLYLSFFVLAGTLLSWVIYIRSLKRTSSGGKILYFLLCVSLLWCSVLILHFQLFP